MNGLQQEILNSDDGVHLYDIFSPLQFGECTGIGDEEFKYDLEFDDNPYPGTDGNRNPLIAMHMQPNQTYSQSIEERFPQEEKKYVPTTTSLILSAIDLQEPLICK